MSAHDIRVSGLSIYPVKSLRGVAVTELEIDERGPRLDREWMIVDASGAFVTQRKVSALARLGASIHNGQLRLHDGSESLHVRDGNSRRDVTVWSDRLPAIDCGDDAAAWLRERLNIDVRLVRFAADVVRPVSPKYAPGVQTGFSDGYPLLLTNEASLGEFNRHLEHPVGMERFRPNVVVSGASAWAEDSWRRIDVGTVQLELVKPCARCVVITTDQVTGERPDGSAPLTALAEYRTAPGLGAIFGQNVVHRSTGVLRVGDQVTIVSTQRPVSFR